MCFVVNVFLMGGGGGGGGGVEGRGRERGTVMFALSGQVENINTCLTFLATLGVSVEGVSAKGTDLSSDTWTFSLLSPRTILPPHPPPNLLAHRPLAPPRPFFLFYFTRSSLCLCSCLCLSLCLSPLTSQIYSKGFSV